ncbi:hypothetical protein VTL71DRAFT_3764 [Oculimacula yallundae]|uniref:NACHT domain-containing protein n=1 Tax=Oculimacula yallundae TaxID=86028 RepID=A0ABR4C3W9_9HELO
MSGAEAGLVLGLISSVIAIVDASQKLYEAASDAKGLPEAFREVAGRLPIVRTILGSVHQHIKGDQVDEASCKAIKPVVAACEEKAKKLEILFQKVMPADDASRLDRYIKAVRTLGKGGRVESWMKGILEDIQLLASNHTMVGVAGNHVESVKEAVKQMSNMEPSIPDSLLQETAFTNNNFGNGPMTNNNVQGDQFTMTNNSTGEQYQAKEQTISINNEHISDQTFHARVQNFNMSILKSNNTDLKEQCECIILSQLEFSGMSERYDEVAEAHKTTFQWIYERPELGFVDWLRSGTGTYWITGKAGSGKSTLMKYLFQDSRTRSHLPKHNSDSLVAGFFFHDRGHNPLLKSQEGLFRAILHEILSTFTSLIALAVPERFDSVKKDLQNDKTFSRTLHWEMKELRAAFKAIVCQEQLPLHLCLMIDGLDEFSGEQKFIIDTLSDLLLSPASSAVRVQLCLSSRQLNNFENAYSTCPHLRVQDLTAGDIKSYVESTFKSVPELRQLMSDDPTTSENIVQQILVKAEGVFLWVTLVVQSLVESLINGDDMKTLQQRLSVLPPGLEKLFSRMIGNIEPFYHAQAAQIIHIVQLAKMPLSVLAMYFTDEHNTEPPALQGLDYARYISTRHSITAKRLKARTAGLVEISSTVPEDRETFRRESYLTAEVVDLETQQWKPGKIQFLHLTVKEFFRSDKIPSWLVSPSNGAISGYHEIIARSCFRFLQFTNCHSMYHYETKHITGPGVGTGQYCGSITTGTLSMIVYHTLQVERITQRPQLRLLENLDSFMMGNECQTSGQDGIPVDSIYSFNGEHWHWTHSRYGDWNEPLGWLSDYVAYLVAIGMTQSTIAKFNLGYNPRSKPGRPLLLYATCLVAPDYAISHMERDTVDPSLVRELLERKCDPNQVFTSQRAGDIRDYNTRTVWEAVLLQVHSRYSHDWARTEDARNYELALEQNMEESRDLKLRWLRTIKLFLEHGANPSQFVIKYGGAGRRREMDPIAQSRVSALLIFNRTFSGFDDPLVRNIQQWMVSKGAIELEEDVSDSHPPFPPAASRSADSPQRPEEKRKSRLRYLPIFGKGMAARRNEKLKSSLQTLPNTE